MYWYNISIKSSLKYSFRYLVFNLFKYFFGNINIDIPKNLINLSSLTRVNNQVVIAKLISNLMVNGNFLNLIKKLNISYSMVLSLYFNNFKTENTYTYLLKSLGNYRNLPMFSKKIKESFSINFFISNFIRKHSSVYSIYIYRINKAIFKNTRGKSGKFMFVWKYIPVYKRLFIVISWLLRELSVINQRILTLRLYKLLLNIINSPNNTWVSRIKLFSHNYVYNNYRKTLVNSYISSKV